MAEHKTGFFDKAEKLIRRRKTKFLQGLGKTGVTKDEELEQYYHRLERQQEVATKFQKDLKAYIANARSLSASSKVFYTTVSEAYEAEWAESENIHQLLTNMDALWQDYVQKLQEQVQDPLAKYLATIPQIKARFSKRGRKLIDFDNAKHNLEVQENAKKKDDAKIAKAKEDLEQAKKIYEDLNNDLHVELPEFYNSRVTFYADTFQKLFAAEALFHGEVAKVWDDAPECNFASEASQTIRFVNEQLHSDNEEHTYKPRNPLRNTMSVGSDEPMPNGHSENGNSGYDSGTQSQPESPQPKPASPEPDSPVSAPRDDVKPQENDREKDLEGATAIPSPPTADDDYENVASVTADVTELPSQKTVVSQEQEPETNDRKPSEASTEQPAKDDDTDDDDTKPDIPDYPPPQPPSSEPPADDDLEQPKVNGGQEQTAQEDPGDDNLYQVPPPPKKVDEDLPFDCLYMVQATHPYKAEDEDELPFEKNAIIYVVKYDDPEEQDDGWLMGIRKSDGKKGVFPENFTKKIE